MSYKRHRKYKAGANWADLFVDLSTDHLKELDRLSRRTVHERRCRAHCPHDQVCRVFNDAHVVFGELRKGR